MGSCCHCFYAKKDIEAGEEIFIDYADPLKGKDARNLML